MKCPCQLLLQFNGIYGWLCASQRGIRNASQGALKLGHLAGSDWRDGLIHLAHVSLFKLLPKRQNSCGRLRKSIGIAQTLSGTINSGSQQQDPRQALHEPNCSSHLQEEIILCQLYTEGTERI